MKLAFPCVASAVGALALGSVALASALEIPVFGTALEAEGKVEFLAVGRFQSDNPSQDPQGRIRFRLGADMAPRLRLQTGVTGTAGGTPQDPDGAGVYDFDRTLQDLSPSLEIDEAYFDLVLPRVDVRAGLQKFAWGKLDGVQPNDLLNPEKLADPVIDDEVDKQIAIPALSVTWNVPDTTSTALPRDLRVTGVAVPIYVPFRVADDDERWYPPLARVPDTSQSMGLTVQNEGDFRNGDVPERDIQNGALAARIAGSFRGADFALYYYDGYDTQPSFEVDARGFVRANPLSPQLFDVRSEIEIFPTYDRIRAAGADVAVSAFDATFRLEGAYVVGRLYPRAVRTIVANPEIGEIDPVLLALGVEQEVPIDLDEVNVERDGVEWGVNVDRFFGETFVLAQMMQTAVLGNRADLLISDTETRFAMTVRRTFLDETLEAELIGLYGMQGVYGVAHPRVTYDVTDAFDVRVGLVWIEGHEDSFLGQYRDNDQAYVRLRYLF